MRDNPEPGILCIGGHFDGDYWTGPFDTPLHRSWSETPVLSPAYDPNRPPEIEPVTSGVDVYLMTLFVIPSPSGIGDHRRVYRLHTLTFLQAFEALVAGYGRMVPTRRVGIGEYAIRDQLGMIGEKYQRAITAEIEPHARELSAILAAKPTPPVIMAIDELRARGVDVDAILAQPALSESEMRELAPKGGADADRRSQPRHRPNDRGRPGPFVVDHAVALTDEQRRDLGLTVDNDRAG